MDDLDDVTILAIVAAVGIGGYLIYQWIQNNSANNEISGQGGGGVLGNVINNTLEIGQSSQSYTSAFSQAILHPINTIGSILGLNQSGDVTGVSGSDDGEATQ
jgi:hypothetical protein